MFDADYYSFSQEVDSLPACTASPERNIWAAALHVYIDDIRVYQRWLVWPNASQAGDKGEAWRDFRGNRAILKRLCGRVELDYDAVLDGIKKILRDAVAGGMQ